MKHMNWKSSLLAISAIAVASTAYGCAQYAEALSAPQGQPLPLSASIPDAYAYGASGPLTPEQSASIRHLAQRQSYEAIKERYGFPDARSDDGLTDYYKLSDGAIAALHYGHDNHTKTIEVMR